MDITWYGHSCFRIAERGVASVVTDPYDEGIGLPPLKLKADVVTVSHEGRGHSVTDGVKGFSYAIRAPGEYEIGGVFITGIALHTVEDEQVRRNVAYHMDFGDELRVLHLGDLAHVPAQSTIEALGDVTVLLVPVGGGNGLKPSMAAEVIALIEPLYIVPMHYQLPGLAFDLEPIEKFLKAIGASNPQREDVLKVNASNLPEQPQVILLNPSLKMA